MAIYNGCCFFGPRKMGFSDKLYNEVSDLIDKLVLYHRVGELYFQDVSGFEVICKAASQVIKSKYDYVTRYMTVPRAKTSREVPVLSIEHKRMYDELWVTNLSDICYKEKERFNQYEMVQRSDFCIFYIDSMLQTDIIDMYKYAKMHKRTCINLGSYRDNIINK